MVMRPETQELEGNAEAWVRTRGYWVPTKTMLRLWGLELANVTFIWR